MALRSLMPFSSGKSGVPDDPFTSLQRQINRAFEDMTRGWPAPSVWPEGISTKVDMKETDDSVVVTAEIPGVDEKDVTVELGEDTLTIRGEKKFEKTEKDKGWHVMERSYGSFSRTLPLPTGVQADKSTAEFAKGVLTVTLPKTAAAKEATRKIEVKAKK